jgi:GT2 family glycosyltransferase
VGSDLSLLPTVSIVTVTFNTAAVIDPFLQTLRDERYPRLEIIVVDNASRDASAALVRRAIPEAVVIESRRNLGFAGASNLGARKARGDILFFLNPDTVLPPDAVAPMVEVLSIGQDVGAVGCKLVFSDGRIQSAGGIIGENGHCVHRGWKEEDQGQYDVAADVHYVPGAALAIRRNIFWTAGGFYEGYYPGFYEDADLCTQLRRRGLAIRYVPRPRIVHIGSTSMGKAYAYWMCRNRLLFLIRNGIPANAPTAFRREARWLYREFLRPLAGSLRSRRRDDVRSQWERLRPILAGMVAAAVSAPRVIVDTHLLRRGAR